MMKNEEDEEEEERAGEKRETETNFEVKLDQLYK